MRKRLRWWLLRLTALALAGIVVVVVLAPQWLLPPLAHWLDVSQAPRPVDYVLVLNGDLETRPFAAAALVRTGLAKRVLLTRQKLSLESGSVRAGAVPSELEITRRILRVRGLPDEAVRVIPGEIGCTYDEAQALAAFLETEPEATVAVVTNGFHTRRAQWVFRRHLGPRAGSVSFVGVPRDGLNEETWWRTPEGCVTTTSEYAKLAYYWIRY